MEKYQICVLGDRNVGKTTITKLLTQDSNQIQTCLNIFNSYHHSILLEWWDFSGNPKYDSLRHLFFQHFHGYVLVFDLSNKNSYKNLKKWEKEIEPWINETNSPLLIVGTKEDLGVTGKYSRDFTKVSKKGFVKDDWDLFFERVVSTDSQKISKLNKDLEETKSEEENQSLVQRLQKWWRPQELPMNKTVKEKH